MTNEELEEMVWQLISAIDAIRDAKPAELTEAIERAVNLADAYTEMFPDA